MHKFTIEVTGNLSALFKSTSEKIVQNGGKFKGDENKGTFEGSGVKGSYEVEGANINITLTDKPFIATWGFIEGKIREAFGA